jgi:hypothetical protein
MIVVDQPDALIDQLIVISLRGFAPLQPVSVTATQTYADATRWQSRATFISNDNGQVHLARQPPVSGAYEGVVPMGLFWSMERLASEARPLPRDAVVLHPQARRGVRSNSSGRTGRWARGRERLFQPRLDALQRQRGRPGHQRLHGSVEGPARQLLVPQQPRCALCQQK